ncbi:pyridoxal phosphate-dependent aminotransferase [Saccharothrix coeruleofusca]|uniref:Aminotransferase n=1 Tax=Saccharothrix coeruleofusca TaxID=33919 RepID=A0A918AS17_9PSEU|nr:pyridoxal phosphate-dependent aminotransferase [Saccharothrix coeruleofusca]GGP76009.1 aminotransferase [Saccharothrix coeruleofusca]
MTTEVRAAPGAGRVRMDGVAGHTAQRARGLRDSELAKLLRSSRSDVVNLAVGTPQFPETPGTAVGAAITALKTGRNQYELPLGEQALRERIASSLNSPADPSTEITVTAGATEGLCVALQSLVDPGDEVVVFEPFYENFLGTIALAGGVPRFVPLHEPDWHYDPADLRAAFGPRTRAVLLNSPSNPTGRALRYEELAEIAELCERWNAVAVSDEAYAGLVFGARRHLSAADVPGLRQRSIVVGSLSKSHAISGWRLGYLRAEAERTSILRRIHEVTTNGTAAPLQAAIGSVGLQPDWAARQAEALACLKDTAVALFERFGVGFETIEGGCFAFGRIDALTTEDSTAFCERLLRDFGILLAPGRPFFHNRARGDRYVRIAFNRPPAVWREVEARLFGRI